jgi:1-acyl-sn-glycerol-3-phosphate acyltransferase
MNRMLRWLFFAVLVRLVVLLLLGLNVRGREHLPKSGPAIIVANHNSHLDTLVLMSLLPLHLLPRLRPVAAAEYFLQNRLLAWFSRHIIGILPLHRSHATHPLAGCHVALAHGDILILFPEGTRGTPEQLAPFKSGIAHLVQTHPEVPVIPVFLHGLGKVLPKGDWLLVPFFCDVFIGAALPPGLERSAFMAALETALHDLAAQGQFASWT